MTHSVEEIFAEAAELGENDRAALAGLLLTSLEPVPDAKLDDSWVQEIRRRIKAHETGEISEVSWEEARTRLWARFSTDR
jgi:putative addiction module component (TIGR02574 family)